MYFWKIDKLESDLIKGAMSNADKFQYLLASTILIALGFEVSSFISESATITRVTESIIVVVATIVGTIWCYNRNGKGDNAEFIDRFICLSFPVGIRLIVYFSTAYTAYMIIGYSLLRDAFAKYSESTTFIDVIFTIGFELFFYWKLSSSIYKVSTSQKEE